MERLGNFCAVADTGSIVGAAKGDPVRQSLISRQIRELESFFGVELIRRRGRGLELTEAGRELAAVGRENFKGLSDYAARCRGAAWTARIVASNSVATWLVLPRLKMLGKASGDVRFEIHHEQAREMVTATREGIYDIAFVRKDSLGPGLRYAVLGEIGHSLLVPKGLMRAAPKNAAAVLGTIPMALPVGGKMREIVERMAEKARVRMNVTVGCSSYLQAAQVLQSGMCATVLPDTALASLKPGVFHRIPLPDRFTLCLAWSARNADTRPALARLIEQFREKMAVAM
jgi:DNA-binding transcriptional LysR family regulator